MNITEEVQKELNRGFEHLTFGMAWAIQNTMNEHIEHHPQCSSVEGWSPLSGPHFLCDCGGVEKLWKEIK